MARLLQWLLRFWRGLATNWVGTAGVVLTTSSFLLFLLAELLRLIGIVTNAYVGLITYLSLPVVFVLGLLLIPAGWWLYRRQVRRSEAELLAERFDEDAVRPRPLGSRLFVTIALFTLLNVVFLGAGSARMLHFMDQPRFCGTACHSVMHPEWIAYQRSPHARVRCVDCHVGQGAEAAVDAKLNGMWQMISVTFDLYERPIPTPVHNLRPARETCERCHWPEMFYGERIRRVVRHGMDRDSTPRYTTLALKIGSGTGERGGQIHWHVAARNEVRYQPADATRQAMRWVEVRQPDGSYRRYTNRRLSATPAAATPEVRVLDCVDCHNRATHIYEDPEDAVDRLLAAGEIDATLPYARRQALAALTGSYPPGGAAPGIDRDLRGFYRQRHPEVAAGRAADIDRAVAALQAVHAGSVHERMNVTWKSYPDHLGHRRGLGCRRCHSPDLVDDAGRAVKNGCSLCHSLLAYDSDTPFQYLAEPDPRSRDCRMHAYQRREFLGVAAGEAGDLCPVRQGPAAPAE